MKMEQRINQLAEVYASGLYDAEKEQKAAEDLDGCLFDSARYLRDYFYDLNQGLKRLAWYNIPFVSRSDDSEIVYLLGITGIDDEGSEDNRILFCCFQGPKIVVKNIVSYQFIFLYKPVSCELLSKYHSGNVKKMQTYVRQCQLKEFIDVKNKMYMIIGRIVVSFENISRNLQIVLQHYVDFFGTDEMKRKFQSTDTLSDYLNLFKKLYVEELFSEFKILDDTNVLKIQKYFSEIHRIGCIINKYRNKIIHSSWMIDMGTADGNISVDAFGYRSPKKSSSDPKPKHIFDGDEIYIEYGELKNVLHNLGQVNYHLQGLSILVRFNHPLLKENWHGILGWADSFIQGSSKIQLKTIDKRMMNVVHDPNYVDVCRYI